MENINNKGVTLVETIVAIAVIVIISVVGYSVCSFSVMQQQKLLRKNFFINETHNILACYYSPENDFEDNMIFLTGNSDIDYSSDFVLYYTKNYDYALNMDNSTYYLTFTYNDSIKVYKSNNNTLIYDVEV